MLVNKTVSENQKKIVLESFSIIKPRIAEASDNLYKRLFELEPTIRHIFPGNMEEQKIKFSVMLTYMVENIDHQAELKEALPEVGRFHFSRGISEKYFESFRESLLYALRAALEDHCTPEIEEAWNSVYTYFFTLMTNVPNMK